MREIIAIVVQKIVIRVECILRLQIKQLQAANVIIIVIDIVIIIGSSRILSCFLHATTAEVVIVYIHR